jgi:hypothetical protein
VRRRAYWSVFAGAFGHTYGANGVFQFHKDDDPNLTWSPLDAWDVAIDYPGADHVACLRRLMESRPLAGRVPRQNLLLSGATELVPRHVQATLGAGRNFAMIYVPQPAKTIVVDMRLLAGAKHRLWWFEPSTCQAEMIGEFRRADYRPDGALSITTPPQGQDWVLVIDRASANFGPPGESAEDRGVGDEPSPRFDADEILESILSWGQCPQPCPPCAADLDGDCDVDGDDLAALLAH